MLGKHIMAARKAAGLTQEQVAAKARISREHLSRLEHDEVRPTVDTLIRIAKAIGIEAWPIVKAAEQSLRPDSETRTQAPRKPRRS